MLCDKFCRQHVHKLEMPMNMGIHMVQQNHHNLGWIDIALGTPPPSTCNHQQEELDWQVDQLGQNRSQPLPWTHIHEPKNLLCTTFVLFQPKTIHGCDLKQLLYQKIKIKLMQLMKNSWQRHPTMPNQSLVKNDLLAIAILIQQHCYPCEFVGKKIMHVERDMIIHMILID